MFYGYNLSEVRQIVVKICKAHFDYHMASLMIFFSCKKYSNAVQSWFIGDSRKKIAVMFSDLEKGLK